MTVGCKKQIHAVVILIYLTFLSGGASLFAQNHSSDHGTSSGHDTEMQPAGAHAGEGEVSESHASEGHSSDQDEHAEEILEEEKDAAKVIMEHIRDAHDWHILTTKDGKHVSIPLPVILYSKHSGFHAFMSSHLAHGHTYKGFKLGHGTTTVDDGKGGTKEKSIDGKIVEVDEHGEMVEAGLPLDFSITKNVFMMFLGVVILLVLFLSLARSYKKVGVSEPKGIQGFLEPLIVFVEEDIAQPNIAGDNYKRFMPYLLTVFFFILIHNLMGLIPFFPFGANVTGNIAVTMVLAVFTMLLTNLNGNKAYWRHTFAPPGVPVWLLPIMIPVELLSIITKPFALMVRLFANITAGHIIVLSLVSLIFIFQSVFMSIPSLVMVIFMDMIEILVAFLQAYIFTLLSALFIGLAMPEHHHE